MKNLTALVLTFLVLASGTPPLKAAQPRPRASMIVVLRAPDASPLECLAAREIQRYVYLRTGRLLLIQATTNFPSGRTTAIIVSRKDGPLAKAFRDPALASGFESLKPQEYWLKSVPVSGGMGALVAGGDPVGALYGAYRFAERLGVRFYLHGDVIPDDRVPLDLASLDERAAPLFPLRGIQPFHDFPEGPDWWNTDTYEAVIAQLPKLRMNFFGLHTYPEGGPNAEPTVWIGQSSDVRDGLRPTFSFPSSYQNTLRGNWGYEVKKTSDFSFGATQLFDQDAFGSDVMSGYCPQPTTPEAQNDVFARAGALLRDAFNYAHALGVKTCVGTETPLTIPQRVKERLKAQGKDPADQAVVREVYEGMFRRIMKTYPLDYYWFWTPEGWTWEGTKKEQVSATLKDLNMAIEAAKNVGAPFHLATCGWVLGPPDDRALFDKTLPKDMPLSCINREVGKTPVEPGFAQVQGRSKWAIPWLEDDPALTAPQLWVGRMRQDAVDALRYGCDGLMGIHWRTRVLGPNVSALAQAAWSQDLWKRTNTLAAAATGTNTPPRYQPTLDFYRDWSEQQFGRQIAEAAALIFEKIDGNLPRPADWVDGPGGLKPDPRPWEQVSKDYAFVEQFGALGPQVEGVGNRERYSYWLDTFHYLKAMGQIDCLWAQYNQVIDKIKAAPAADRPRLAREQALPLRKQMAGAVSDAYDHLLASVSTMGELGTIANWEQHIFPRLLTRPGEVLSQFLGEPLPSDALLPRSYDGPLRIIVPTVRTSLAAGENLRLKVIVLAGETPRGVVLFWRELGRGQFQPLPASHVARGVYAVQAPMAATSDAAFEYFIEVTPEEGKPSFYPVTAPKLNQTVVVFPAKS